MCDNLTLLLDRIKADPDDLTLRLAYSDELEEVGGGENRVRAELVRVMVDIYRDDPAFRLDWSMNTGVFDNSADERIRRTAALVRQVTHHHLKQFSATLLSYNMVWRRGFPEEFRGTIREWAEVGDRVCATGPVTLVEFRPWYWGDVFRHGTPRVTRYDLTWGVEGTYEVVWEVKGKPPVQWQWKQSLYRESNAVLFNADVQHETIRRTTDVFRGWWPTVKTWKGIPTE